MSYKILCIDGGGIKGVFSLEILKMLQEDLGKGILSTFDCYSGTSTGALIVSAIIKGYQPRELIHFYTMFGRKIFPKKRRWITSEAKYNQDFLQTILRTTLSEKTTFADLQKKLIIPACALFNLVENRWGVEVYDNFNLEKAKSLNLVDVALRSSAAPIYFPSYQSYVDGGIYALNPSLVAFSKAIDKEGGNREISDIKIVSIGSGINPSFIKEEINWGVDKWMSQSGSMGTHPLISLLTDVGSIVPDYPLKQILKNRYLRINNELSTSVEIDDPSKISVLRKAARDLKEKNRATWDNYLNWFKD